MKWFRSVPLAEALDEISAHAPTMTFSDEKSALDQLESEILEESRDFLQEVRRRIAERILSSATSRGLPLRQSSELLSRVVRLGFTDLIQEALIRVSFCRYLIAIDEVALATAMLKKLKKQCAGTCGRTAKEMAEIRKTIDTLLESIRR